MNSRKRAAEEPIFPIRSSKQTRNALLRYDGERSSPSQVAGLLSRWLSIASQLFHLSKDTLALVIPTSNSSDTALEKPLPPTPLPSPSPPPAHSPPTSVTTTQSKSLPPSPRNRALITPTVAKLYVSVMDSPSDHPRRRHRLRASPPPHAGPSSEVFPSNNLPIPDRHGSPETRAALDEAFRDRMRHTRPHILASQHKRRVAQQQREVRDEMVHELYERERKTGYRSNRRDFEGLLHYRATLEGDRGHHLHSSILSASSSMSNIAKAFQAAEIIERPRRHSYANDIPPASDEYIRGWLNRARETREAPPPPKPFSPSLEQLQTLVRLKDASIEQRLRKPKPSLPTVLPPKVEKQVAELLNKHGIIAKYAREQVSQNDIARLRPGQWLNDEIINFYGSMILGRTEAESKGGNKENSAAAKPNGVNGVNGAHKSKAPDIHYFSTFFWTKLEREGYKNGRLNKWTKKMDIFAKDIVVIPVNHGNSHWTGAAINFRKKRIEVYDSMNISSYAQKVFKGLRAYLDAEHQEKKKKPFDWTGWQEYKSKDTPQQENAYDCGVFTCQFLETLARGEESFSFTQENIPLLRRKMIWEIGNQRFWEPES